MHAAPTPLLRLAWLLGAALAAGGALGVLVAFFALEDALHDPLLLGEAGNATLLFGTLLLGTAGIGLCLGRAIVPKGVAERGRTRTFALGIALLVAAVAMALPVPFLCLTTPIGALLSVAGVAVLLRARRPA